MLCLVPSFQPITHFIRIRSTLNADFASSSGNNDRDVSRLVMKESITTEDAIQVVSNIARNRLRTKLIDT